MDEQRNTLQSTWRYWIAVGACGFFLVFFFMDMGSWHPVVVAIVVHLAMIVPALCLSFALRALLKERFGSNLLDGSTVALAVSLLIHLLAQMTGELLYGRLLPIQTDFARAGGLEIALALVCLGGAYATGVSLLVVGIRLRKVAGLHWGLRRPLVYAFFACGLFMTGYSIFVTLHGARVSEVFTALAVITFQLTDLTFVVLCLLLMLTFVLAAVGAFGVLRGKRVSGRELEDE
ncbi:MAG: hypothetical protein JXA14_18255 [Anaerolineae bacterium]|nr:hypothetical protein [Anaerolineae bacterium]